MLREQLVGTWSFVIAEITAANGKKSLPFGDKPKGMIIFTADGHFSQVHVAGGLPRIASNNRLAGTAEDNKAIVAGTLAQFGTYSVDEAKRRPARSRTPKARFRPGRSTFSPPTNSATPIQLPREMARSSR
jgi:hypothetical protein